MPNEDIDDKLLSKFLNTLEENDGGGDMRKLIECPVCLEIPLPPIFLCERGHIVCTECQERTPNCPLCRSLYSKTRSFVAEGIVEKCMLKCKYAEQGCKLVLKGSEMAVHLKICDFRPITCVDCNFPDSDVNYMEYLNHLIKVHKINGVHECFGFVLYNMDLTKRIHEGVRYCWPPYYFKDVDQSTFLIRMHVSSAFVCAWVSLVGTKEDCNKFEVVISFHVPRQCLERNKHCFSLTWRGPVNHFRDDGYHDIFNHGKGLIIPADTIREVGKVSEVVSEWMYHVNIVNMTRPSLSPDMTSTVNLPFSIRARKESSRSLPYKSKEKPTDMESPITPVVVTPNEASTSSSFPIEDQKQSDSLDPFRETSV